MSICDKPHRSARILEQFLPAQDTENGRHLCPGCALEAGFRDGLGGNPCDFESAKSQLDESQAMAGRHKSAKEAYEYGYKIGKELR